MASIKMIGSTGTVILGKKYAGRQVLVDELEPGVWMVKTGRFVPDCERRLQEAMVQATPDGVEGV